MVSILSPYTFLHTLRIFLTNVQFTLSNTILSLDRNSILIITMSLFEADVERTTSLFASRILLWVVALAALDWCGRSDISRY